MNRKSYALVATVLLIIVAVVRVIATYRDTAENFDEPCHVSAAIEFLDRGTYKLDPYNTPLARIAIGLPLYLAGARYPNRPSYDPATHNYIEAGNEILYGDGHYMRNLYLARSGVLPFLILCVVVVFIWAYGEFGAFAALMAVALLTTLPAILAFSSIAYTDMAAACMQCAAFFAFTKWLDKPSWKSCIWFGIMAGLALLAKFTTLVYLPAGAVAIACCKWLMTRREPIIEGDTKNYKHLVRQTALALLAAVIVIWGGYRFSVGRVQDITQITPQSMPSFQHFPSAIRPVIRKVIVANPALPAPDLLYGIVSAYAFNQGAPASYLFGKTKNGGWWYFFFVDMAFKTPLAFLILSAVGFLALADFARQKQWKPLSPAVAAFAVLLSTMTVKVNYGIRHVIVLFPLLAIVAGYGATRLWSLRGRWSSWGRLAFVALLIWQGIATISARHDYIAYFNELGGDDPSKILLGGCDLDCGQDLFRLSSELKARHISQVSLALWTAADMEKTDLPSFTVPKPNQLVTGWFAISAISFRTSQVFHTSFPPNNFAWLDRYKPVALVGKSIRLYYIPESRTDAPSAQDGTPTN